MDVGDILTYQPELPDAVVKRKHPDFDDGEYVKRKKAVLSEEEKERILMSLDQDEQTDGMDEGQLKKMILNFEKRVYRNQEMRIKYPDLPEKFMESEIELNDTLNEMHVIATVPDMYGILVDLNSVQTMIGLLNHENTDISIAVVDLLQEMTDVDSVAESDEGANILIDALLDGQVIALLVQNMERLDETVKEEADGIHNTLGIVENMTELRPEVCIEAAQQGLMAWLLKRIKAKMPFDGNKLYSSEILSILLQNHEENRQRLGEVDGIDVLLQQLAVYKKHDPSNPEEIEYMENLFNCMCCSLMYTPNRERFLRGEGLQLMNLMLREKKMSRASAMKVLNHAMTGPEGIDNCQKFVDILGLRSVFPLFMKTPKVHKKISATKEELEEHIISVISSMVRNCTSSQRDRLLGKFSENDHEKVDRLMELHFQYLDRVNLANDKIEREKHALRVYGGEIDDEMEDQFYIQRLEAGLFTLQLVDYIMMEICALGASSVKQRVMQILNMRGASAKAIKAIMREYAGNLGDAMEEEEREAEQDRILQLVEKFSN